MAKTAIYLIYNYTGEMGYKTKVVARFTTWERAEEVLEELAELHDTEVDDNCMCDPDGETYFLAEIPKDLMVNPSAGRIMGNEEEEEDA